VFKAVTLLLAVSTAGAAVLEDAKRAFDAGDYVTAVKLFDKAYHESKRCDVVLYLGLAKYRLTETSEAIIAFKAAVQCDPKLILAHLSLAEAYSERGNQAEALAA
jgi:tetratricopeptide (TPR) repeat protein